MTREDFQNWVEAYLRPQEQCDPECIRQVFAEDGVYWWGPFNESRYGIEAIYQHHKHALSHQSDLHYTYEILAVTETCGIARFHLTLTEQMPGAPDEYDGIFLVYLNAEHKCTRFEEWYHSRTRLEA